MITVVKFRVICGSWADLVFAAAQVSKVPELYDGQLDERRYLDQLRQYDVHRDPRELAAFIGTQLRLWLFRR